MKIRQLERIGSEEMFNASVEAARKAFAEVPDQVAMETSTHIAGNVRGSLVRCRDKRCEISFSYIGSSRCKKNKVMVKAPVQVLPLSKAFANA